MIKHIYIILLLLTIISCNKKEDFNSSLTKYVNIDRVINTGSQFNGMSTEFAFTIFNDYVLLNPQLTNDGFSIKVYDIKKNNFTQNYFKVNRCFTDTLKHYFGTQPWDIDADSFNIYALFGDRLLIIDRNNTNKTYLTNLKEPYQKLKVFRKELFLWRAYNFTL